MMNVYEIFRKIPHERINNQYVRADEQFDVFHLGVFNVKQPLINAKSTDEIVELVELQPNSIYKPHYHRNSCAVIYIVLGDGDFILNDIKTPYQAGSRFVILQNEEHGFSTKSSTLFLSIQSPPIRDRVTGAVDLHYV